jgi:hypothetical protein
LPDGITSEGSLDYKVALARTATAGHFKLKQPWFVMEPLGGLFKGGSKRAEAHTSYDATSKN